MQTDEAAKVDQTVVGENNPRGNCLQAALATLLRLPLDETIDVTAPEVDPELWHIALWEWGQERGWDIASQRDLPPQEWCIAVGRTSRPGLHAVVYRRGELYHDPHPSREGLTKVRYYIGVSDAD